MEKMAHIKTHEKERQEKIKKQLIDIFDLNYAKSTDTQELSQRLNTLLLIEQVTTDALYKVCEVFNLEELDKMVANNYKNEDFNKMVSVINNIHCKKVEVEELKSQLLDKLRENEEEFKEYYKIIQDFKNEYIKEGTNERRDRTSKP